MFLQKPKFPFLGKTSETTKLLSFGDPNNLKEGVIVTPKKAPEEKKTIFNLFDLEENEKYVTQQGHIIKRSGDTVSFACTIKSARITRNSQNAHAAIQAKMSILSSMHWSASKIKLTSLLGSLRY
jgi:hypothetical protein